MRLTLFTVALVSWLGLSGPSNPIWNFLDGVFSGGEKAGAIADPDGLTVAAPEGANADPDGLTRPGDTGGGVDPNG
ncbi:MAG TPA: hypothetical protein VF789_16930 [Thermoanaerobaculia bacterium]